MRTGQYEKAEEYLAYFPDQDFSRRVKQAMIYSETGRILEAYQVYEKLLFESYQMASGALHGVYLLAMREGDIERARMLVEKQTELAKCFEMGKYYEAASRLELETMEKDAEAVLATMKHMLTGLKELGDFCRSPLYEHMEFREIRRDFLEKMESRLRQNFGDEETYGFLQNDERWKVLTKAVEKPAPV